MKVFYLRTASARENCARFAKTAPEGWRVSFSAPNRKGEQNDKYHAQIDEIAKQSTYAGQSWTSDDMKRILVDEFADEMRLAGTPLHGDGRLIPSENGRRVIQLGVQTRDFYVAEASQFIEFLTCWGATRGVVFEEQAARSYA